MANETSQQRAPSRTASCACGALRVTTMGAPEVVNAGSCFNCQKRSGSAFTDTAFFPNDAIKIEGETRSYREMRAAGRWHEVGFCVTCGVAVVSRSGGVPASHRSGRGVFLRPELRLSQRVLLGRAPTSLAPRAAGVKGGFGPPFPLTSNRVNHQAVEDTLGQWTSFDRCATQAV
jgi:hypothetical protein